MQIDKPRKVQSLRGASKREVSKRGHFHHLLDCLEHPFCREELVKDLQKQREERIERRRRENAAERIQSIWKGRKTRLEQSELRLNAWLEAFGPIVIDRSQELRAEEIYRRQSVV